MSNAVVAWELCAVGVFAALCARYALWWSILVAVGCVSYVHPGDYMGASVQLCWLLTRTPKGTRLQKPKQYHSIHTMPSRLEPTLFFLSPSSPHSELNAPTAFMKREPVWATECKYTTWALVIKVVFPR